jgi:hypothetical protein
VSSRGKQTTTTALVTEALARADDFRTARQLADATGRSLNQVHSALWVLKHYYSAVECIEAADGLWWFATAADDKRSKHLDERTPESKPRRAKRRKETEK